jgi:glycerate kinase
MKIVVAPDSFKESMTAPQAAAAIGRGVRAAVPAAEVDLCPVADGGEGTVEALVNATGGRMRTTHVTGPLGDSGGEVDAAWGLLGDGDTAVIEMAAAAGLALVPADRRDPTRTTTFGVGQLIAAAMDAGARRIILGIGGSATTDGGTGMAQALGVRFIGGDTPMIGGALGRITAIDLSQRDPRLDQVELVVACDVTNPLTGPSGAAAVYGPQKGATTEQVMTLDAGLAHLASLTKNIDASLPGAGAAGGLGFGLVAFCGARLARGIDLVLDAVRFEERVRDAVLVITGEGRLDGQSVQGKTCLGVANAARKHGVKTIALVGCLGADVDQTLAHGLSAYHSLVDDGTSPERALCEAPALLEALAQRVVTRYL